MELAGKNVWQIAAGDTNRNYADICLEWDVVLNGPGSEGPWPECCPALRDDWELTGKKLSDLKRFAEDVKPNDIVVLRMGTTDVLGVGIVIGDYLWHEAFGDIDGWDLQHVRRVRWVWKYTDERPFEPKKFSTYAMKFGDTTQLLNPGEVMTLA